MMAWAAVSCWRFLPAAALTVGATFVEFSGPGGQRIYVAPDMVTSVREPTGLESGHWAKGIKCLMTMTNRNLITVTENCDEVRRRLQMSPVFYP